MKYFDQIESYTHGTMSVTDRQAFEQNLASNPELKNELENYKLAKQVSGALAYESAKRKVSGVSQSPLQVTHRRTSGSQLLRIAAALLVLVVCGFLFSQMRYTDTALANQHYRSTSMNMRAPQSDGVAKLIDKKNYEEAIVLLEQGNSNDPLSKGLLAEALTKVQRFPEAINLYKELAADPENISRDGADFALALLYLRTEQTQEATDLLTIIAANEDHDYRFEARKLQSQLQSFWRKLVL